MKVVCLILVEAYAEPAIDVTWQSEEYFSVISVVILIVAVESAVIQGVLYVDLVRSKYVSENVYGKVISLINGPVGVQINYEVIWGFPRLGAICFVGTSKWIPVRVVVHVLASNNLEVQGANWSPVSDQAERCLWRVSNFQVFHVVTVLHCMISPVV